MYEYRFRIWQVYDGDTIHAWWDYGGGIWNLGTDSRGIGDRYRLARINAPELRAAGGVDARDELARLILGPFHNWPVDLTVRTVLDRRDNYGRILVELTANTGENINNLMVASGHATYL